MYIHVCLYVSLSLCFCVCLFRQVFRDVQVTCAFTIHLALVMILPSLAPGAVHVANSYPWFVAEVSSLGTLASLLQAGTGYK